MKKYKYLTCLFVVLAILLSNVMCATVAYNYCNMKWSEQYLLTSAPAWVSFLFIIPYTIGISICMILAWSFNKSYSP